MKILFNTLARTDPNLIQDDMRGDYMSDLLFHGLRELYGDSVVDIPKKKWMYTNYEGDSSKLWGRGFSYSKTLEDIEVDRNDIDKKIMDGFYNIIIASPHHSVHSQKDFINKECCRILGLAPYDQVLAVIDGHDTDNTYDEVLQYTPYLFKREIPDSRMDLLPISFAIPRAKVRIELASKTKLLANIVPCDHSHPNRKTHKYEKETDYYQDYAESYFAFTCKKGGWDCMRHYEIISNGCIPIFTDIERCSKNTLITMPKKILSDIKDHPVFNFPAKTFDKNQIELDRNYCKVSFEEFEKKEEFASLRAMCTYFLLYAVNLTTIDLACYFIKKLNDTIICAE